MRYSIFLLSWIFMVLLTAAYAGELREIEMVDGSIISAEVVSLSDGVYRLRSSALGTIDVPESKVRAIRSVSSTDKGSSRSASLTDTAPLQERMLNDKEIMNKILLLQNDPEFMKILEDPQVMKAVNEGDIAALTANPRFMKLLDNAVVQDIQKKVK